MRVYIERGNRTATMHFSGPVSELLKRLKLNQETVLVARNNALVTEDSVLENTDDVKILSVVSGG